MRTHHEVVAVLRDDVLTRHAVDGGGTPRLVNGLVGEQKVDDRDHNVR